MASFLDPIYEDMERLKKAEANFRRQFTRSKRYAILNPLDPRAIRQQASVMRARAKVEEAERSLKETKEAISGGLRLMSFNPKEWVGKLWH